MVAPSITPGRGQDTVPAAAVADLISAVREALTLPEPVDVAGAEARARLLDMRATHVAGALAAYDGPSILSAITSVVRDGMRRTPATYPTRGVEAAGGAS
ncbi:hypothetical protein RM780_04275 [Streptomyces sp. DSM 44917]|uniref:Uncharacterized protein n=1 Tax=Streptomyces boetiae TaxID=3075541 RepID=A0ABU2L3P0_9ACTN|nr:hypothetical protein [Streptomyces sp. DSM 44917]MDT0306179.1 hypothetical protein [Streptomyces sp. DSM 44917]